MLTPEQIDIIKRFNELPMMKENFKGLKDGDHFYSPSRNRCYFICTPCESRGISDMRDWLWIPPVDDIENQERTLWGMLDWEKWGLFNADDKGKCVVYGSFRTPEASFTDTPTFALMKAIIWQEEHKKDIDTNKT